MAVDEHGEDATLAGLDEDTPVLAVADKGGDFSLVDTFKSELDELASNKEVFIPVKGYERTGLQIKYHLPEHGKELDMLGRKVQREAQDNYTRNLLISIDTMIYLCSGIYVQPPDVEAPVMLDPENTGSPAGFDDRLAELMGMDPGSPHTARNVVKRLFGGNEMMLLAHAERLQRWLQNTKADLNAELWQLGE